jgi:hypothetical protein
VPAYSAWHRIAHSHSRTEESSARLAEVGVLRHVEVGRHCPPGSDACQPADSQSNTEILRAVVIRFCRCAYSVRRRHAPAMPLAAAVSAPPTTCVHRGRAPPRRLNRQTVPKLCMKTGALGDRNPQGPGSPTAARRHLSARPGLKHQTLRPRAGPEDGVSCFHTIPG